MKKLSLWVILIGVVPLALSACSPNPAVPTTEPQASQQQRLIAEGRLLPLNSLGQSFTVPGQVAEVMVEDGDVVTAGQELARLADAPDAEAVLARAEMEALTAQQALDSLLSSADLNLAQTMLAYQQAKEQAEAAESRFEADASDDNKAQFDVAQAALKLAEIEVKKLESGRGVNPEQLAAAQARLASARAAVASAQFLIDARVLRASVDGTVVDLSLQAGEQVSAGNPVIVLADFSNWIIKTENLTEMEIAGVQVGQKVEVVLDALPEVILAGQVTHINSRFEEKRGDITYTVTIQLEQVDPQMRWGMTAAVRFIQ